MAASVKPSRFSLLKIEDDESDEESGNASNIPFQKVQKGKGSKNKKKRTGNNFTQENAELRNMAFGGGGKKKKGGDSAGAKTNNSTSHNQAQLIEWEQIDKQGTADLYEKDLEQAILMSKLELEQKKQTDDPVNDSQSSQVSHDTTDSKPGKKKKKAKDKAAAVMSLEQFNHLGDKDTAGENSLSKEASPPAEPDPKFFDQTKADAQKIIQKERIQEEYRKTYVAENARAQQFLDDLQKKNAEVDQLKEQNEALEKELKQVKRRNQQLCIILSQGEMKDKTMVLMELEELKSVRDELTTEVTALTCDLEKERSKVHGLEAELKKTKGGKSAK